MKKPVKAPRRNVQSHQYDVDTQTLTVTFHTGKTYRYSGVPHDLADGFSGGQYLRQHIIGKFPHELIG